MAAYQAAKAGAEVMP
ncbi:MAG: hypothetical protein MJ157_02125 [Clostridia bacterium]|nr:hypothetical protein [Clostridia bacterium]